MTLLERLLRAPHHTLPCADCTEEEIDGLFYRGALQLNIGAQATLTLTPKGLRMAQEPKPPV